MKGRFLLASVAALALLAPRGARAADKDGDGITGKAELCPDAPETKNGWKDEDGCPDELATIAVQVKDLVGEPIPNAKVRLGGDERTSDAEGRVAFEGHTPEGEIELFGRAAGYLDQSSGDVRLKEGKNKVVITLDWVWVPVTVTAKAADTGTPVNAHLRFDGPGNIDTQDVGWSGTTVIELRPGTWKTLVYADRFEAHREDLVIAPDQRDGRLEVALLRAPLDVSKEEILHGARVHFEPGSAALDPSWRPFLDDVANTLLTHTYARIAVHGHADGSDGSKAREVDLPRTAAAIAYLVERGIAKDRLEAVGHGWEQPLDASGTPAAQATNRRVEFQVLPLPRPDADEIVYFAAGSAELGPDATLPIEALAAELKGRPLNGIEIHGHADPSDLPPPPPPPDPAAPVPAAPVAEVDPAAPPPPPEDTRSDAEKLRDLSLARAEAVKAALVAAGVPEQRLSVLAWSDRAPLGAATRSRRVSFTVLPVDDFPHVITFPEGVAALPVPPEPKKGAPAPPPDPSAIAVERVASRLAAAPGMIVEVRGRRAPEEPEDLGRRRAQAVHDALLAKGVDPARVRIADLGTDEARGPAAGDLHRVSFRVVEPQPLHAQVHFEPDGSAVLEGAGAAVADVAAALRDRPSAALLVTGHTDASDAAKDPALGLARAEAVKAALVAAGAPAERIATTDAALTAPYAIPSPEDLAAPKPRPKRGQPVEPTEAELRLAEVALLNRRVSFRFVTPEEAAAFAPPADAVTGAAPGEDDPANP